MSQMNVRKFTYSHLKVQMFNNAFATFSHNNKEFHTIEFLMPRKLDQENEISKLDFR